MPIVLLTGASGFLGQHLAARIAGDRSPGPGAVAPRRDRPGAGRARARCRCAAMSPTRPRWPAAMQRDRGGVPYRRRHQHLAPEQRRADADQRRRHRATCWPPPRPTACRPSCTPPACRPTRTWCMEPCARMCRSAAAKAGSTTSAPSSWPSRPVRESGLPFLIFQPSHILGPGDTHNWSRLIRLVDHDKLPGVPPGSGAFADVREIAKAQVRAWQAGAFGETYLLGGEHASFLDTDSRSRPRSSAKRRRSGPRRPSRSRRMRAGWTCACRCVTRKAAGDHARGGDVHLPRPEGRFVARRARTGLPADRRCGTLLADTIAWLRAEKMPA